MILDPGNPRSRSFADGLSGSNMSPAVFNGGADLPTMGLPTLASSIF